MLEIALTLMSTSALERRVQRIGWFCTIITVAPSIGYLLALTVYSEILTTRVWADSPISFALMLGVVLTTFIIFVAGVYINLISRLYLRSGNS